MAIFTGTAGDDTITPGLIAAGVTSDPAGAAISFTDPVSDLIHGGEGNDTIDGGGGDDILYGGDGRDVIFGGHGNDDLTGGPGDDMLYGDLDNAANIYRFDIGWGHDRIEDTDFDTTVGGIDEIRFGTGITLADLSFSLGSYGGNLLITRGADSIEIVAQYSHVYGLNGFDDGIERLRFSDGSTYALTTPPPALLTQTGTPGADHLTGTGYDDTLYGLGGDDSLAGGESGNDRLYGGDGNDELRCYDGNNQLYGGDGDDLLIQGAGDDIVNGGEGDDTAAYGTSSGVTVTLALTVQQDTGSGGLDTLIGIENLQGSRYDDNLTGDAGDNRIEGSDGNDILAGGAGTDTASYVSADGGVTVSLAEAGPQDTGGAGIDTLSGFENLLGGRHDDHLSGDAGDNRLDGGLGNDTVSYFGSGAGVTVSLANSGAQDTAGAGTDTLVHLDNLAGSAFDDRLTGDRGDNEISGFAGNDTLLGLEGRDTLIGGDGVDTASYGPTAAGVTVSLAVAGAQDTGGAGVDTLVEIENLTGSAFADSLTGDAGKNRLIGAGGDDHLDGGVGFDLLVGGMGRDIMTGGNGSDRFEFNDLSETGRTAGAADRITDFVHGVDRIDLIDIDANPAQAGDQAFTFIGTAAFTAPGQAHVAQTGGNNFLELNTAGPSGAEAVIELDGLVTLTAMDLLL